MKVKFYKRHPNAQLPKRNHGNVNVLGTGDTGYDVYAIENCNIPPNGSTIVETGIDVAYIEPGYWFLIAPRSGLGFKHSLQPHLGTVDNPYRGNCSVKLYNFSNNQYNVAKGDRIAQLIFFPLIEADIEWTESVESTHRGDKNLGSSGK